MDTLEITLQYCRGDQWPVVAEHRRPGALPVRAEGRLQIQPAFADFDALATRLTALLGAPRDYGTCLGEALFQGSIRDRFMAARAAAGTDGVRTLLVIEDPALQSLRWERLCAPDGLGGWDFLALDQRSPYSRYLPSLTDRRFPAIGRRDLRALVVLADPPAGNPYGLAPFDAAATAAGIAAALGEIPHDLLGPLAESQGPASLDALAERITLGAYTLLHLVAHGMVRNDGETVLYLLEPAGQVEPVTATDLIRRLGHIGAERGLPHLVFLATCEGAKPEAETALGGLAQRLVRDLGVPAVVAMTDRVSMATALPLGRAFYARLRATGEPDLALVEAGAALQGRSDCLVPALFGRLAGRPLFSDRLDGDRPLTPAEIDFGLAQLVELIPERAPTLLDYFAAQAQSLRDTLGTDTVALSEPARHEREAALDAVDALAQEVLDLSFPALALGQPVPAWDWRCPFPGLKAFQSDDQAFFFGRESQVRALSERLRAERLLAVLGASGSGKSSLVLAGLVPAFVGAAPSPRPDLAGHAAAGGIAPGAALLPVSNLEEAPSAGEIRYLTPGADPESALARQLAEPLPAGRDTILVVDQLEELFTLCTDPTRRQVFIDRLLATWRDNTRLYLVFTLRADFWGDCAPYPALKDLMQAHQELIAPMTTAELRSAMEQQAAAVGLRFEADLSHTILAEVEGEPGAMPLLQHLLLELWRRRHGRWLRVSEYRALGGIKQAIAHTADGIYAGLRDDPGAQGLLRNLFVRLTRLDDSEADPDGRRDTRQRVPLPELTPAGADPAQVRTLVQRLADARLVVTGTEPDTGETQVEVSHEALIRHWPRLRGWLDEDRASWILLAAVREQARDWHAGGEREADLPRWGGRLQQAETLFAQERFAPTESERRFVDSAKVLAERERTEREEQQRQRLEALEKAATEQRRKARVAWIGAGVAFVLLAVAVFFGVESNKARDEAVKASQEAKKSERKALDQTAITYWNSGMAERDREPLKAVQSLARAADLFARLDDVKQAANAEIAIRYAGAPVSLEAAVLIGEDLGGAVLSSDGTRFLTWDLGGRVQGWDSQTGEPIGPSLRLGGSVDGAEYIDNDSLILAWGDHGAGAWDSRTGADRTPAGAGWDAVRRIVLTPDRNRVLLWKENDSVILWEGRGHQSSTWRLDKSQEDLELSADGTRVLTLGEHDARISDSRTGKPYPPLGKGAGRPVRAALSPAGNRVFTTYDDGRAQLWDVETGKPLATLWGPSGMVETDSFGWFSRDGERLLTWESRGGPRLWNGRTGEALPWGMAKPAIANQNWVHDVGFSVDGTRFLAIGDERVARIWDSRTGEPMTLPLKHPDTVSSAQFSRDASRILTWTDFEGAVRIWSSQPADVLTLAIPEGEAISGAGLNADGSLILTWGEGGARLWDRRTSMERTPAGWGTVRRVIFDPERTQALFLEDDGTASSWNSLTGELHPLDRKGPVKGVPYRAAGTRILAWGNDASPSVWDWQSDESRKLEGLGPVQFAALSPDGTRIATWGDGNTVVRIWNSVTATELASLKKEQPVSGVQFSADGSRIVTWLGGEENGTATVYSSETGVLLNGPFLHERGVNGAQFGALSPSHLLTWAGVGFFPDGNQADTVHLWDLDTGQELIEPLRDEQGFDAARFGADDSQILTYSLLGEVRLWDARTGDALTPHLPPGPAAAQDTGEDVSPDEQDSAGNEAADLGSRTDLSPAYELSSKGDAILVWGRGGVRLWSIARYEEWLTEKIMLRTEVETGTTLTEAGELKALTPTDWQRKRFCEYDAIRRKLERLSDAEWAESQRLCRKAQAETESPP
jgi:WD40 repeat protein